MERLLLAEIKGNKKFLERLIDREIYTPRGRLVGRVWKIYVSKRTKTPIKIVVKTPGGKRISVDPGKVLVSERGLILQAEDTRRLEEFLSELKAIVKQVKRLHSEILVADERLINGEISREEYLAARARIDARRAKLLLRAKKIVLEIEAMRKRGEVNLSPKEERLLYKLVDYLRGSVLVIPLNTLDKVFL